MANYEYTYLANTGCDCILNRKSSRTDLTLVAIFSQGILGIVDEKHNTFKPVVNYSQLVNFLPKSENNEIMWDLQFMKDEKNPVFAPIDLENVIMAFNDTCPVTKFLIKRNLISYADFRRFRRYNNDGSLAGSILDRLYKTSPKLLEYLLNKHIDVYNLSSFADSIIECFNLYNIDIAKYYVDQLDSVMFSYNVKIDFKEFKKYNLDVKRGIDYLLFELPEQCPEGYYYFGSYIDYLDVSKRIYGEVKEKYPKDFLCAHDIIMAKYNDSESISDDAEDFETIMKKYTNYKYRNPLDKFQIVVPKTAIELVNEGSELHHCVADYVHKVVNGDCVVVFMREEPTTSYLTIEISEDNEICQIEGLNKRSDLTDAELLFIERWANAKNLKVTAPNCI